MSKEMIQNLIFVTIFYNTAGSSLTVEPQNVFIHEDEKFEMVCCSKEETVSWNYYDKSNIMYPIHDGDIMAPAHTNSGFSVKSNKSCSSLTHNSIQFEHSGIYGCNDFNSPKDNTARLLVLRKGGKKCSGEVTCNERDAEYNISIQCLTMFSGVLEPVIKCKNAKTELYKETIKYHINGMEKTVENNLRTSIQDGSKNVSVDCEIFFNVTDQYPLMAKNNHRWSTNVTVSSQCDQGGNSEYEFNQSMWIIVGLVAPGLVIVVLVVILLLNRKKLLQMFQKQPPKNVENVPLNGTVPEGPIKQN